MGNDHMYLNCVKYTSFIENTRPRALLRDTATLKTEWFPICRRRHWSTSRFGGKKQNQKLNWKMFDCSKGVGLLSEKVVNYNCNGSWWCWGFSLLLRNIFGSSIFYLKNEMIFLQLDTKKTLWEQGITHGSTLNLIIPLDGGMKWVNKIFSAGIKVGEIWY